jgi:hypothetical protein
MTGFEVELANDQGVPLVVRCSDCGTAWWRPPHDPAAATLALWTLKHQQGHDDQLSMWDDDQ